jgi:hypothetical protein
MRESMTPASSRPKRPGDLRWAAKSIAIGIRCMRLAAFLTVALVAVLGISMHHVRADMGEKMLHLGHELLPMADLLQTTQRVRINGESMYLASTVTDQSIGQVLDRYEAHCRAYTGGLAEQFDALPADAQKKLAKQAPAAWSQRLGIVREQHQDEGMLACIAQQGQGGIAGFVTRVNAFMTDGDLGRIGNLRFAYLQKTEDGKTHLLTTFTEGSFNLFHIIGADAASEGTQTRDELDAAPMPPNAKTPMTFRVDDLPYAVQGFHSPDAPQKVAAYYLDALPKLGWKLMSGPGDLFQNVIMRRGGVTLVLTANRLDDREDTQVVVTEAAPAALASTPAP